MRRSCKGGGLELDAVAREEHGGSSGHSHAALHGAYFPRYVGGLSAPPWSCGAICALARARAKILVRRQHDLSGHEQGQRLHGRQPRDGACVGPPHRVIGPGSGPTTQSLVSQKAIFQSVLLAFLCTQQRLKLRW
jgi:hypothetical protein